MRPRSLSTSCTSTSTMSPRSMTSSMCATRPGPTFETWSRPSVPFFSSTNAPNCGRLHDLARVRVADLRGLREGGDGRDRRLRLRSLGRVDEDRAVLLDVDLHLVVGLERADRLAALADDHADLLRIDLDASRSAARGRRAPSVARGALASIVSRMDTRACFACSSAERMISCVTPVILMSIWRAVIPSRVPATLKSMSPR